MPYSIAALLIAIALATLTGCGQMGPLYMPPPEETSQDKPTAQAQPSQPSAEEP